MRYDDKGVEGKNSDRGGNFWSALLFGLVISGVFWYAVYEALV